MLGSDKWCGSLFSYVDLDERVPARHPLRKIRAIVNDALAALDADLAKPSWDVFVRCERCCGRCYAESTRDMSVLEDMSISSVLVGREREHRLASASTIIQNWHRD